MLFPNLAPLPQREGAYFLTPGIQGDPLNCLDEENEGKGCHTIAEAGS